MSQTLYPRSNFNIFHKQKKFRHPELLLGRGHDEMLSESYSDWSDSYSDDNDLAYLFGDVEDDFDDF